VVRALATPRFREREGARSRATRSRFASCGLRGRGAKDRLVGLRWGRDMTFLVIAKTGRVDMVILGLFFDEI